MIKHTSFKHGWFYHYRIHEKKVDDHCQKSFSPLKNFLYDMFDKCPNEYFQKGPRSSSLKIDVKTDLEEEKNSVTKLAKEGLLWNNYKTAHSNVQMFMLNFDKNTVGVEIPIWLMPEELDQFKELFNEEYPLTGHIDALQVKDQKIWVWDYKPNAHLEKYATTQTYFYALMLSKRTGIPLEKFMCGYFDDKTAYTFNPSKTELPMISLPVVTNL